MAIIKYSENVKPDESLNKIETYDFTNDEMFGYEQDEEMKIALASEFAYAVVARNTVDNLTSTDTDKALSANQGKVLDGKITNLAGTGRTIETVKGNADAIKQTNSHLAIVETDVETIKKNQNLNSNDVELTEEDIGIVSLPANAIGRALVGMEGLTATNIVDGAGIANGATVIFASILNYKYYDVLHGTILTGTGSDITVTNDTGATADIAVINLTATFGSTLASAYTTVMGAKQFPSYFSGTQSIKLPMKVVSEGKNIIRGVSGGGVAGGVSFNFDGETVSGVGTGTYRGSINLLNGKVSNYDGNEFFNDAGILLQPGTYSIIRKDFTGSGDGISPTVSVYSGKTAIAYRQYNHTAPRTFTLTEPTRINSIRVLVYTGLVVDFSMKVMIVEGSYLSDSDIDYEPYRSTSLYLTDAGERRSIQDVLDTVAQLNGEYIYTQRVSTPEAVLSGVAVNTTNYPLAKNGGKWANELTAGGTEIGVVGTDSTTGAGTLRYQLATPIETKLTTIGNLLAFPNGRVRLEPNIIEAGIYDSGYSIANEDYPIDSIVKVTKIDSTGAETDITDSVIDGDSLGFTSASLSDGDVVVLEYAYESNGIQPDMTVNFNNNALVVEDESVAGNFYRISFVVDNGVLTPTATLI